MRPLLEVLRENGEMYRHDAIDAVVKKMNLTQDQLAEKQIISKPFQIIWAFRYKVLMTFLINQILSEVF